MSEMTAETCLAHGTLDGDVILLKGRNFPMEPPVVTAVRTWLYSTRGRNGRWEGKIKAPCYWCGNRFPVADEILELIRCINRDAKLREGQSPCLELSDEAWDEPRLLSECPLCHKPLKFNPFIVDHRDRY